MEVGASAFTRGDIVFADFSVNNRKAKKKWPAIILNIKEDESADIRFLADYKSMIQPLNAIQRYDEDYEEKEALAACIAADEIGHVMASFYLRTEDPEKRAKVFENTLAHKISQPFPHELNESEVLMYNAALKARKFKYANVPITFIEESKKALEVCMNQHEMLQNYIQKLENMVFMNEKERAELQVDKEKMNILQRESLDFKEKWNKSQEEIDEPSEQIALLLSNETELKEKITQLQSRVELLEAKIKQLDVKVIEKRKLEKELREALERTKMESQSEIKGLKEQLKLKKSLLQKLEAKLLKGPSNENFNETRQG